MIKDTDIDLVAKENGLTFKIVKTIILIESSGSGFDPKTGLIKIQFEPHIFKKYTGIIINNKVDVQGEEWKAFNEAYKLNSNATLLSTSFGLGQIMGFNFKAAGFKTVEEMYNSFKESEINQLRGMIKFIVNNKQMYLALCRLDWETFARLYNGPGYKKYSYDDKLRTTYEKIKGL